MILSGCSHMARGICKPTVATSIATGWLEEEKEGAGQIFDLNNSSKQPLG
jgi:hypothetical protein